MPRGRCWPERRSSWRSKSPPRKYEDVSSGFGGLLRAGWMGIVWRKGQGLGDEGLWSWNCTCLPRDPKYGAEMWVVWGRKLGWSEGVGLGDPFTLEFYLGCASRETRHCPGPASWFLCYTSSLPLLGVPTPSGTIYFLFFLSKCSNESRQQACWLGQQHAGRIAPNLLQRSLFWLWPCH